AATAADADAATCSGPPLAFGAQPSSCRDWSTVECFCLDRLIALIAVETSSPLSAISCLASRTAMMSASVTFWANSRPLGICSGLTIPASTSSSPSFLRKDLPEGMSIKTKQVGCSEYSCPLRRGANLQSRTVALRPSGTPVRRFQSLQQEVGSNYLAQPNSGPWNGIRQYVAQKTAQRSVVIEMAD